jgi:hypothetical protein
VLFIILLFFNISPVWALAVRFLIVGPRSIYILSFVGGGYGIRPIVFLVEDGVNPLNLPAMELYAMAM